MKKQYAAGDRPFDDLDALAGAWSGDEAAQFAAAIAPFGEVQSGLWIAQPKTADRAKPAVRRKRAK